MRLRTRLITQNLWLSLIAVLISVVIISILIQRISKTALENEAKNHLIAVREIQKNQIERYFSTIRQQIISYSNNYATYLAMNEFNKSFNSYTKEVSKKNINNYETATIKHYLNQVNNQFMSKNLNNSINSQEIVNSFNKETFGLQYHYIVKNKFDVGNKDLLVDANDGSQYSEVHSKFHKSFKDFKDRFGFYDLLLIDPKTSHVIYSVEKELDFATSLENGPFSDTNLARAYRLTKNNIDKELIIMADFEPYKPSYNQPAAFITSQIISPNGELIGVLALQIPIDKINSIMTMDNNWDHVGLGYSGESFLVGYDYKLRSSTRLFLENPEAYIALQKSLGATNANLELITARQTEILSQNVKNQAVIAGLSGKSGITVAKDYRDKEALISYAPINVNGLRWVIISKVDIQEAFGSATDFVYKIINFSLIIAAFTLMVAFLLGVKQAKNISKPIEKLNDIVRHIAKTQDLTKRIKMHSNDEISEMADSINRLIASFQKTCKATMASSRKISNAAKSLQKLNHNNINNKDFKIIKDAESNLNDLSTKLVNLAEQFEIFEEEQDKINDW